MNTSNLFLSSIIATSLAADGEAMLSTSLQRNGGRNGSGGLLLIPPHDKRLPNLVATSLDLVYSPMILPDGTAVAEVRLTAMNPVPLTGMREVGTERCPWVTGEVFGRYHVGTPEPMRKRRLQTELFETIFDKMEVDFHATLREGASISTRVTNASGSNSDPVYAFAVGLVIDGNALGLRIQDLNMASLHERIVNGEVVRWFGLGEDEQAIWLGVGRVRNCPVHGVEHAFFTTEEFMTITDPNNKGLDAEFDSILREVFGDALLKFPGGGLFGGSADDLLRAGRNARRH